MDPERWNWEDHFYLAVHFGATEIVQVLLDHPKCDNIDWNRKVNLPPNLEISSLYAPKPAIERNELLKWESDEPLGDQATIAMILYSNKNHPNLKSDYPHWPDRIKQITKIWNNVLANTRAAYVQQARENRTAGRVENQVGFFQLKNCLLHT